MASGCSTDWDCTDDGRVRCVVGYDWIDSERYPEAIVDSEGRLTVCLCDLWLGLGDENGRNCEIRGRRYKGFLSVVTVLVVCAFLLLIGYAFQTYALWRRNRLRVNTLTATIAWATGGLFWMLVYNAIQMANALNYEHIDVLDNSKPEERFTKFEVQLRFLLPLGLICSAMAFLTVSLMWVDVVKRTAKLASSAGASQVAVYKKMLKILLAITIAVYIPAAAARIDFLLVLAMVPTVLVGLVTYTYGSVKMARVLSNHAKFYELMAAQSTVNERSDRVRRTKKAIRTVLTTAVCITSGCLSAFIIAVHFTVAYAAEWKSHSPPWRAFTPAAYGLMSNYGVLFSHLALFNYIVISLKTSNSSSKSSSSKQRGENGQRKQQHDTTQQLVSSKIAVAASYVDSSATPREHSKDSQTTNTREQSKDSNRDSKEFEIE